MKFKNVLIIESIKNSDEHIKSVSKLKSFLDKNNIKYSWIYYSDISKNFFIERDLIITIGGDGVLIRVSHFIKDNLILAINSDIKSSEGAMLCDDLDYIEDIFNGNYKIKKIVRGGIILNGKEVEELFLNEVYVGCENQFHTSRYIINYNGKMEEQRSSGILISTGNGSTAWYSSAGGEKFNYYDEKIKFIIREPFFGKLFKPSIFKGEIDFDNFSVLSKRNYGGCIAIDGCVVYPFNNTESMKVLISKHHLNLIVNNNKPL